MKTFLSDNVVTSRTNEIESIIAMLSYMTNAHSTVCIKYII